jgi:hypothetical protein
MVGDSPTTTEYEYRVATVWYLGKTREFKMIHRPGCRHARAEYQWAGFCTAEQLAENLGQARSWHRGCIVCAPDLNRLLGGRPHAVAWEEVPR